MLLCAVLTAGCSIRTAGLAADGGSDAGTDGGAGIARDGGLDGAWRVDGARDAAGLRDGDLARDAPMDRVDAGSDAGPPDAGPPDAGPPDAGPPDAGPPDAGPPDAGPPDAGPPSCDSVYGAAQSYVLCAQRATECEFYTNPSGDRTCDDICADYGGTCLAAYREESDTVVCTRTRTDACDSLHNDEICVCTRW
jgi:hypothetical protein